MKKIILYDLIKIYFCTVVFFLPTKINAQETIQTEFISIADGLASGNVQDIIEDSYGLMWVATDNGLHQYDGYQFTRFKNIPGKATSLLNDVVWGIAEDKDKNIWAGTDDGISKYDRRKNEFTNYDFAILFNA